MGLLLTKSTRYDIECYLNIDWVESSMRTTSLSYYVINFLAYLRVDNATIVIRFYSYLIIGSYFNLLFNSASFFDRFFVKAACNFRHNLIFSSAILNRLCLRVSGFGFESIELVPSPSFSR